MTRRAAVSFVLPMLRPALVRSRSAARRSAFAALVVMLAVILAPTVAGAQYGAAGEQKVSARDDFFEAEAVHVPVGTTVEWTNDGREPHNVTADDGSYDSGNLGAGARFSITFRKAGAYPYYCKYHGSKGGLGMSGVILVGDAALPSPTGGRVGPGREAVPSVSGRTLQVPQQYGTIQSAVDAAKPGDLVLVSPGEYHEAVKVTTPYLTIRGEDRNLVVLDGDFTKPNGIHVIEADGVSVENMTARHYLLNGFYWTTVNGYRGSYLTAYDNGDYGLYAFDSVYGRFEHSYASGHPDSGIYIGQCFPCHAVIDHVTSADNGIGYSGTNAGGDLKIVNSTWTRNQGGIVPNTLDSERLAPQRGVYIAGNKVYDNNNAGAPAKTAQASALGIGILLAGGRDNVVEDNMVWDHDAYGIAVFPNLDKNFWIATGNVVRDNWVRGSGRADLVLSGPAGDHNCFSGNDFHSSLPPAIQTLYGCGHNLNVLGGGDLSSAIQTLGLYIRAASGRYPHGDWRTQPAPAPQPQMPRATVPAYGCSFGSACPPLPAGPTLAIPGKAVPGPATIGGGLAYIDLSSTRKREVTMLGVTLAAPTWWSLLLATYAYLLPLILYVAWVSIAIWDLIRQDAASNRRRMGWMAAILLVPLLGPILYYVFGRSPIPRSLRTMLVAGGLGIYIVIAVLAVVIGGS
jgi:plastocyanin